ncbi:MAG: oatA [Gammaproteobacteria bacterium]|jgi:peptidoglycan/LPS O-acetylase OafA/YrhL|nr:oatA [Gammaproteobacteria bacterium]
MIQLKRNLELDRLRAFAVLMTIFIHFSRIFFPWNIHQGYTHGTTILNLIENSWAGVDLFFVISGYIISKMIVEKIDSLKGNTTELSQYIKGFYIRRFFRIYPVAWTIFALVLFCSIFFNHSGNFSTPENVIESGITIFTYTFNYYFGSGQYHGFTLSPYWSLSVEEQFYLVFPFLLIFIKSHRHRVLLLLGALILITFLIRPLSQDNIFYTQNRCDGLIYGCLLYYLTIQPWFKALFSPPTNNQKFGPYSVLILLFALGTITSVGFPNAAAIPLGCILSFCLVGIASIERKFISFGNIANKILDYIGSRSYSLYLIHLPIFTLTQEFWFRASHHLNFPISANLTWGYTIMAFMLTSIASEISYRLIERPFIKKGQMLTNSTSGKPTAKENLLSVAA